MLYICEKTRGISFHACWLCLCAVCVSETKAYMAVLVCCVIVRKREAVIPCMCCVYSCASVLCVCQKRKACLGCARVLCNCEKTRGSHSMHVLFPHVTLCTIICYFFHSPSIHTHTHIPSTNHITQLTIFIRHTHLQG